VRKDSADARKSIQSDKALIMSYVPTESIALHIVRHLVRGLGKTQGQGVSIQTLRHWWTMSLGQQSENFELGISSLALSMPVTATGSSADQTTSSSSRARVLQRWAHSAKWHEKDDNAQRSGSASLSEAGRHVGPVVKGWLPGVHGRYQPALGRL
jgi:hypothetical protein